MHSASGARGRAEADRRLRDYDAAIAAFTDAMDPSAPASYAEVWRAQACLRAGMLARSLGRDGEPMQRRAIAGFDRILEHAPGWTAARSDRGSAWIEVTKNRLRRRLDARDALQRAIDDLSAAIDADGTDVIPVLVRAEAWWLLRTVYTRDPERAAILLQRQQEDQRTAGALDPVRAAELRRQLLAAGAMRPR